MKLVLQESMISRKCREGTAWVTGLHQISGPSDCEHGRDGELLNSHKDVLRAVRTTADTASSTSLYVVGFDSGVKVSTSENNPASSSSRSALYFAALIGGMTANWKMG